MKQSRNEVCRCGSGKKYKKCCLAADEARHREAPLGPPLSPSQVTKLKKMVPILSEALSETVLKGEPEPCQGIPQGFDELAASVEEEIGWPAPEGDSDLDIVLAWWLEACKTVEQRQIFEEHLAGLRLQRPDLYFAQTPAFTALLRVVNALEMGRHDVVRDVVEDGERLVQGDNEANSYGSLVRLLGWHGHLDLMVRAVETALPGLEGANLLRREERMYAQWLSAGRMLLAGRAVQLEAEEAGEVSAELWGEFVASQIAQGCPASRVLLQATEVETLLWEVRHYQQRQPGLLPDKWDVMQYLLDAPDIQSLVLMSALPAWCRLVRQRVGSGSVPVWHDLLRDRLRDASSVCVTGRVREDAARLVEELDATESSAESAALAAT